MEAPDDDLIYLDPPRQLLPSEHALIERLLEAPFRGRDAIRSQLRCATVIAEGRVDTRSIRFELPEDAARAETKLRVPVEAECADDDGVSVAVLLHIVDGLADELEVYRVDGQPIRGKAPYGPLTITVNEEADHPRHD